MLASFDLLARSAARDAAEKPATPPFPAALMRKRPAIRAPSGRPLINAGPHVLIGEPVPMSARDALDFNSKAQAGGTHATQSDDRLCGHGLGRPAGKKPARAGHAGADRRL